MGLGGFVDLGGGDGSCGEGFEGDWSIEDCGGGGGHDGFGLCEGCVKCTLRPEHGLLLLMVSWGKG